MNKFLRNLEMLDEEMDTQPNPRQPRTQISSDTKSTRNKRQLWRSSDKKLLAESHLKGVLARDKEGDARESGRCNLARMSNNLLSWSNISPSSRTD